MIIVSTIGIILGGINWLSIGLLQYDFIAGFFGTQASIFSRLLYIAIGVCTIYVIFDLIRNRGKILLFSRHKKNNVVPASTPQTINQTEKTQSNDLLD